MRQLVNESKTETTRAEIRIKRFRDGAIDFLRLLCSTGKRKRLAVLSVMQVVVFCLFFAICRSIFDGTLLTGLNQARLAKQSCFLYRALFQKSGCGEGDRNCNAGWA
jgi:hypothetical protein